MWWTETQNLAGFSCTEKRKGKKKTRRITQVEIGGKESWLSLAGVFNPTPNRKKEYKHYDLLCLNKGLIAIQFVCFFSLEMLHFRQIYIKDIRKKRPDTPPLKEDQLHFLRNGDWSYKRSIHFYFWGPNVLIKKLFQCNNCTKFQYSHSWRSF